MFIFFATTVVIEVSFAVSWWLLKKTTETTYYISKNTAIVLYNSYKDSNWFFTKKQPLSLCYKN